MAHRLPRRQFAAALAATALPIPAAIGFHNRIGCRNKLLYLQSLHSYWVDRLPGLSILTLEDPARCGPVTSLRLPATRDYPQAQRLSSLLLNKHRVLAVARRGIAARAAIRLTPALYNTTAELNRFINALRAGHQVFQYLIQGF